MTVKFDPRAIMRQCKGSDVLKIVEVLSAVYQIAPEFDPLGYAVLAKKT